MNLQIFGSFYPFNPLLGQKMQSDVKGMNVDASFIAHFQVAATDAVVADDDGVLAAVEASQDTTVVVTEGFTNPTIPRNITVTAGGTAESIKAVSIKVTGTNVADEVITEELPAFTAATAATKEGTKAFKTVTKVEIPAMSGAGVTISIGFGEKLGLPYKLSHDTCLGAYLDNVLESTAPAVTVNKTAIENNTIDLSSSLSSKVVDAYFIV